MDRNSHRRRAYELIELAAELASLGGSHIAVLCQMYASTAYYGPYWHNLRGRGRTNLIKGGGASKMRQFQAPAHRQVQYDHTP